MDSTSNKLGLVIVNKNETKQDFDDSAFLDTEVRVYKPEVIMFKLDNVLVDTTTSVNQAIKSTYKYFTGRHLDNSLALYTQYLGGFDNKVRLVHHLISQYGFDFAYDDIFNKFQEVYWDDSQGLIDTENLIVDLDILETLYSNYSLVLVSNSPKIEVDFKLHKFGLNKYFSQILTEKDFDTSPSILAHVKNHHNSDKIWYIGNSIDDMKLCVNENILGIAICTDTNADSHSILMNNGAYSVLKSVNLLIDFISKSLEQV